MHIVEMLNVIARGSVRFIIPDIRVACGSGEGRSTGRVDGEMQSNGAVALVCIGEMLDVIARGGVGFIIPSIRSASFNRE